MRPVPRLVADKILSLPNHGYASIITDPKQLVKIHCHSYYELFLVTGGSGIHVVNLKKLLVACGDLYFMRPDDVHCYTNTTSDFKLVNILLPTEIFDHLSAYLGDSFREELLSPKLPPHTNLTSQELKAITQQLEQLVLAKKILHQKSDTLFRITIFNLLTQHLMVMPQAERNNTPEWLRWLSLEMLKKDNFTEGLPALYRLSGKSIEHLSRACRKYLQKSPTELINSIRLEYACDLIQNSDMKIVEISADAGFDSLSHFYHLFKQRYSMSPNQLRKACQEQDNLIINHDQFQYDAGIPSALPFELGLGDAEN